MANKIGRNKKACEKYKNSGHREINKQLKQERNKKRIARFESRKAAGKSYADTHTKEDTAAKIEKYCEENGFSRKYFEENKEIMYQRLFKPNRESNQERHTEVSRWKSIMRKLDNELTAKKIEEKKKSDKKQKSGSVKNEEVVA